MPQIGTRADRRVTATVVRSDGRDELERRRGGGLVRPVVGRKGVESSESGSLDGSPSESPVGGAMCAQSRSERTARDS